MDDYEKQRDYYEKQLDDLYDCRKLDRDYPVWYQEALWACEELLEKAFVDNVGDKHPVQFKFTDWEWDWKLSEQENTTH